MAEPIYLEHGPKRVFACSLQWPGWCRVARSEDDAIAALASYAARYAPVARAAGESFAEAAASDDIAVIERVTGTGATDFGVPEAVPQADAQSLEAREAVRLADLVAASWRYFDEVAGSAPAVLRKGPRGGGRDRDQIVEHVAEAERSYARKLGIRFTAEELAAPGGQAALRNALLDLLRAARAGAPLVEKGWPPRYAARRIAWHVLDHAWEIEDKSELDGRR